jgi:hypothetical protein
MSENKQPAFRFQPVHGACRWIDQRHGVLQINRVRYTVVSVGRHYRLLNWSNGKVYSVDRDGRWCTCPSFIWYHCPVQAGGDGRCKHIAALRSLGLFARSTPLSHSA